MEDDPPPHLDLEKLAQEAAKLDTRPERICQAEPVDKQVCLNLIFELNKVRVSWERTDPVTLHHNDWEHKVETTVAKLHRDMASLDAWWDQDWDWIHDNCQIYYSDDEEEEEDVGNFSEGADWEPDVYYSDVDSILN